MTEKDKPDYVVYGLLFMVFLFLGMTVSATYRTVVMDEPGIEDIDGRTVATNATHKMVVSCDNGVSAWDINSTNSDEERFTENCKEYIIEREEKSQDENGMPTNSSGDELIQL